MKRPYRRAGHGSAKREPLHHAGIRYKTAPGHTQPREERVAKFHLNGALAACTHPHAVPATPGQDVLRTLARRIRFARHQWHAAV
jgi:hypothetical protein